MTLKMPMTLQEAEHTAGLSHAMTVMSQGAESTARLPHADFLLAVCCLSLFDGLLDL